MSAEGKWTPGPWAFIGTDPNEGWIGYHIKAQPSPALRGFTYELAAVFGSPTKPDAAEANARLIASAPDMAEALREAEAAMVLTLQHNRIDDSKNHINAVCDALTRARAALAKGGA